MRTPRRTFLNSCALGMLVLGLAACDRQEAQSSGGSGPAEQAGRKIDEATVKAGEQINRAAEKAGEGLQRAGEKMQQGSQEAQREEKTQ